MKKLLFFILITLTLSLSFMSVTAVYAGTDNVVVQFTTVGPDTYADGTLVMDGECYALVWTPTGKIFGGINPDGTAVGDSKVVFKAPFAKDGHCPNIMFQADQTYVNDNYPNGTWGVYLLDTRKIDGKNNTAPDVGNAVNGYRLIISDVKPFLSPNGAKGSGLPNNPAGIQPPTINDFKVINGMAYIFIKNTASDAMQNISAGQNPGTLAPTQQQPVLSGDGEIIVVTPTSHASPFFDGVVQTTFSMGDIYIVISIATVFIVAVVVMIFIKKKNKLKKQS